MSNNEKKPEATKKAVNDTYVEIDVPRAAPGDDPNLVIGINGKLYIIPRGKKTKVPRAVAREYERSKHAQAVADDHSAAMVEKAAEEAKNLNV